MDKEWYQEVEFSDYLSLSEKLKFNPEFPLLLIYGKYEPTNIKGSTPTQWNDEILRLDTNRWKEFNLIEMEYNKKMDISIEQGDDCDYDNWYKTANIKIVPLKYIDTQEKIDEIIKEIFEM